MTPREAVAWLIEGTAAARKTYCIILRSTNGVHNPKRPPWYMMNIAHPVMGWLYNQYLAKLGEVSPPGDACRTRFELSLLHPAALKKLAEHYKIQ